jgi:hypothetical protein
MAGTCHLFNFVQIEIFGFLILALVFITELFDIALITGTAELADYLFSDVSTDVLAVLRFVLFLVTFLFLLYFPGVFAASGLFFYEGRRIVDEQISRLCLPREAE